MQPFTSRRGAGLFALLALALVAAACSGGGGGDGEKDEGTSGASQITPVIVSSELVVGENRFMTGLLSDENEEIFDAQIAFRFFPMNNDQQDVRAEAVATPITLEKTYTETHEDGTVETHPAGESGVYVATVEFDEAGLWGVEVSAVVGDTTYDPIVVQFTVLEESATVAVGDPAPASETLTLADVDDVAEIDTSDPPIPEMHELTIAEAVSSGKPSVIVFATPAFCVSRICGPTKDVVDDLFTDYADKVNFVHIEPYDLEKARSGEGLFPVAATDDWGLRSEPWVFIVDKDGNLAAKFEAVVTREELEQALTRLLDGGASSGTRY